MLSPKDKFQNRTEGYLRAVCAEYLELPFKTTNVYIGFRMFERSGCLRRLGETIRKKRQGYEVICDISFCSVSCVCYQLSAEDLSQLSKDIAMKSVRSPAILAQVAACHRYARRFLKRLAVE